MGPQPIRLTDYQMALVESLARHVSPVQRGRFLQLLADALRGQRVDDRSVSEAGTRAVRLLVGHVYTREAG
jgi:hypothetical protein